MAGKTALIALFAFQIAVVFDLQARAGEVSFSDFPFTVHCEHADIDRAFYLATIDWVAVYISPDRQAGTVTIDGPAQPVGGEWSGSCAGKTIEQLRAAGQAFDLK